MKNISNEQVYKLLVEQSKKIDYLISLYEAQESFVEQERKTKYLTIKQLAKKTGYSVSTLYDKVKLMELNKHYFKPNKVKLLFAESAIDFLVKGENGISEKLNKKSGPISLDDFLNI